MRLTADSIGWTPASIHATCYVPPQIDIAVLYLYTGRCVSTVDRLMGSSANSTTKIHTQRQRQTERERDCMMTMMTTTIVSVGWDQSSPNQKLQNCGQWLEIAQWSQWGAHRKLTSLFLTVRPVTPTISPSLKMWGSRVHPSWYVELQMAISQQRFTSCLVLG